jgi:ATP-dependent exoDNAse (exonuclease V) alpha subunit
VQADDPETAVPRIIELVKERIPLRFGLDPVRDIQVLCPMNRGGVGARSLNIELQAALNPAGERKVERFGWTFAPGDKIMQIEKRQRRLQRRHRLHRRCRSRRRRTLTVAAGGVLGVLVSISSVGAGAIGVTALIILEQVRTRLTAGGRRIRTLSPAP